MSGLTEARGPGNDNFWTWRQLMYRFLDRGGPEEIQAISAMAFKEMLEGGFTRVVEFHYLHKDPSGQFYADRAEIARRIAAAASESGIGLTLLPVSYEHSGFGARPPEHGQRRFITSFDAFADLAMDCAKIVSSMPSGVMGVAPHSLRAVSVETLQRLPGLFPDGPIHIHTKEVEDCLIWSGARPVEWLLDNAPVDRRWTLIHATHVNEAEWRGIASRQATVGLCPITEANLGDGVFPAADFLQAGGLFGVGTDSNVQIGLAEELRMLEYSQRLTKRERAVLADRTRSTARALLDQSREGGARASGVETALRQGAPADIVILDGDRVAFAGREDDALLDSWLFSCPSGGVASVWQAGREVVREGRHIHADRIERDYRAALLKVII
ncbi:hypothetical protein LTR94_024713 [Friedmanniomyces endolithicus]|nr:hypothetical protein LTR94_024713 [Friedmanniomyces endolithicus]